MGVAVGCALTLVEAWVGVASPMAWAVALVVEVLSVDLDVLAARGASEKVFHEVSGTLVVAFGCSYFLVAYYELDVGQDVEDAQQAVSATSVVVAVAVLKD